MSVTAEAEERRWSRLNSREEPRVGELLIPSLFPRCQGSDRRMQPKRGKSFPWKSPTAAGRSSLQLIRAGASRRDPWPVIGQPRVTWPEYWPLIGPDSPVSPVTACSPLAVEVKHNTHNCEQCSKKKYLIHCMNCQLSSCDLFEKYFDEKLWRRSQ